MFCTYQVQIEVPERQTDLLAAHGFMFGALKSETEGGDACATGTNPMERLGMRGAKFIYEKYLQRDASNQQKFVIGIRSWKCHQVLQWFC